MRMPRGTGKPVAVFAGGWHSLVITDTDKVVGWGLNNWGQLGVPVTGECFYTPTVIRSLSGKGITQLACGEHHTLALTSDGTVLSFGRAAYGRLGRPAGEASALTPGDTPYFIQLPNASLLDNICSSLKSRTPFESGPSPHPAVLSSRAQLPSWR